MAYQALLFCPDEKTARIVTQVLSELDFQVSPCTEPFAAVKKLMAERFDAVVVDCDNEQNATLLFKSAHNSPNNSSALAVAVVEGQAGVAKAFRIGANLVLTKPINVEQAKGTLRVARGLLRKNESAKTAPAPAAPTKPARAVSEPAKVLAPPATSAVRPNFSMPSAAASAPSPKLISPPKVEASGFEAAEDEILSVSSEPETIAPSLPTPAAPSAVSTAESPVEAKAEVAVSKAEPGASSSANRPVGSHGGAASAPAPALEPKAGDSVSNAKPEPETFKEKVAGKAKIEGERSFVPEKPTAGTVAPPTFGMGESETKPSGGGKKALLAVAAVVLIAVAGYWAWTQFGGSRPASGSPAQTVQRSIPSPSLAPQPPATPATALPQANSAAPAPSSLPAKADADAPSSAVTETPRVSSSAPAKENSQVRVDATSPSTPKATPVKPSNETEEPVHPIIVKGGTAITKPAKPQTDAAAPEIASITPGGNSVALPNLGNSSNEPAPVLAMMSVSQGVSQGLIIKKISPSYPANALRMRIEGQVELLATVSKKGDITAVKVVSGDPNLTRAAVDAVKQWKYKPYLLDGAPVEMQTQITVNFRLPR